MARTVLITQCIQNDFIRPLAPQDPLPNLLHVGWKEAGRLCGDDPTTGPLAQILGWARQRQDVAVVHVRDWHDDSDPAQQPHLERFGPHCLQNTPGARLVASLGDSAAEHGEHVVNAIALNDFEHTTLPDVLDEISRGEPLRIGVVGVWTEAKVTFLLYDLCTRYGVAEAATCSALTASNSRSQHFNSLNQLERILGVEVFDSVGAFAQWLGEEQTAPSLASLGPISPPGAATPLDLPDDAALSEQDHKLLSWLYRDSARVTLDPLGGGFSGASVFRANSINRAGLAEAPSVAKLGPRAAIGEERVAFERVESVLGNSAPSIRGFVDHGDRAGIKYSYAAMGQGQVTTFKSLYENGAPLQEIERVLNRVFGEILERFYSAAHYEPLSLIDYYGFAPRHAAGIRARIARILAPDQADAPILDFGGEVRIPNVADFYQDVESLPPEPGYHYVSWVHGDLNGANMVIDGHTNVWIIDFFHTAPGHVLKDLLKLANDLLYIFTPLRDEADFSQALHMTRVLSEIRDLRAELPSCPAGISAPALQRAWATLRILHRHIGRLAREDRDPYQYHVAALRYAAHTLSFDESSPLQKRWALAAACTWARSIRKNLHQNHQLRVDWVAPVANDAESWLGLTLCPGRQDRDRVLADDLQSLVDENVDVLVSLVTDKELVWAGVPHLVEKAASVGIRVVRCPILDQSVPSAEVASDLVRDLTNWNTDGKRVVLHCMGGLGRSGLVAACALINQGLPPSEAILEVRKARSPRAIETPSQEEFVMGFSRIKSGP